MVFYMQINKPIRHKDKQKAIKFLFRFVERNRRFEYVFNHCDLYTPFSSIIQHGYQKSAYP